LLLSTKQILYQIGKVIAMKNINLFLMFQKVIFFVIILFYSQSILSQKIFSTEYESQADISVYVVDYESQADLKVYKVNYSSQAGKNDGSWFFVEYSSQADKKIYFVDYESQADLKIFFVDYQSHAGWKKKDKMHLVY